MLSKEKAANLRGLRRNSLARATGLEPVTYGLTGGHRISEKFFMNIVCAPEIKRLRIVWPCIQRVANFCCVAIV